jgi:hypothetical protein
VVQFRAFVLGGCLNNDLIPLRSSSGIANACLLILDKFVRYLINLRLRPQKLVDVPLESELKKIPLRLLIFVAIC